MTLQQRLRELRSGQNLTLKELGERAGLSVSYLSDIERGRTTPTLGTLETLAIALNMTVVDLLTGVDFAEASKGITLPSGLAELRNDAEYGDEITDEWIETLRKIQMRGKHPSTKREWLELYLHLKRILEE